MGFRDALADTRPLKVPAFRRLWSANILTQLGAQISVVAVPAQIYALTQSSGYVGLTGMFGVVPLVIFGLYGGSIADAFDKRSVLMVTTVGMIAAAAAFWTVTASGAASVWWLLGIYALQQAFFAVNQPTRTAVVRQLVPFEQLPAATSLNMILMQGGAIIGPLVAGALIPVTGFQWLYAIDAALLLPTLLAVVALPSLPPVGGHAQRAGLRSIASGLSYLLTQPILLAAMGLDLIAMVFGMPRALYPEMADVHFGGSSMMLSLLYSAIAVGAVLGGLFSGWLSRVAAQGRAVVYAIVAWGATIALAGVGVLAGWPVVVIAMLVAAGAADMFSAALRHSIVQQSATESMMGRVQGVYVIIVVGGPQVADMGHGWAAQWGGAGWTTIVGGVAAVVGTVWAVSRLPSFWHYTRPIDSSHRPL
ncbi:MFS transporter [Corynebacterium uterequi]|uniref:Arabinose efflux permease family protein n=1 Tax=Corynebacterium uterequi TaxID=1072256 RepID=A0A0G3H9P5_9CORY|nr:MFS transporter [Corynebacterium uterequi]AKK10096.1 arabinose efflux permease family protein [Corynebacterium uterequi]